MDIRDAEEKQEHRYTDNGEEICCPICGAMWLEEVEDEFTSRTCEHAESFLKACGECSRKG